MFRKMQRQVRNTSELTSTQKVLMLMILIEVEEHHGCRLSHGELGADAGLSIKTVMTNVNELESKGWLKIKRNTHSSHQYFLPPEKFGAPSLKKSVSKDMHDYDYSWDN